MHTHSIDAWTHEHLFLGAQHARNERRTWLVVALTAAMMVAEIVAGSLFGSMALIADGWHMATHTAAIAIAALAYRFARTHAHDPRFSFGTGKVGELAAFASALLLGLIAGLIAYESFGRLMAPVDIRFDQAIAVAVLGLMVNLASAWLLSVPGARSGDPHHHADDHGAHGHHRHGHHGHDSNIRAAYLHVLADALTSVLAIVALLAGRQFGWNWLDPVIGVVGALIIARWSWGLLKTSAAVLLDAVPDPQVAQDIRARLEIEDDRIADLHLWHVGPGHQAAIVSLVTHDPQPPAFYKRRLSDVAGLSHVTVEVATCDQH